MEYMDFSLRRQIMAGLKVVILIVARLQKIWMIKTSILTGISNASEDDKKVINTAMSYNYQGVLQNDKLNAAVLDNATGYRFVFKKNADSGLYYFYKFERV